MVATARAGSLVEPVSSLVHALAHPAWHAAGLVWSGARAQLAAVLVRAPLRAPIREVVVDAVLARAADPSAEPWELDAVAELARTLWMHGDDRAAVAAVVAALRLQAPSLAESLVRHVRCRVLAERLEDAIRRGHLPRHGGKQLRRPPADHRRLRAGSVRDLATLIAVRATGDASLVGEIGRERVRQHAWLALARRALVAGNARRAMSLALRIDDPALVLARETLAAEVRLATCATATDIGWAVRDATGATDVPAWARDPDELDVRARALVVGAVSYLRCARLYRAPAIRAPVAPLVVAHARHRTWRRAFAEVLVRSHGEARDVLALVAATGYATDAIVYEVIRVAESRPRA
jgi:hypothetical protein